MGGCKPFRFGTPLQPQIVARSEGPSMNRRLLPAALLLLAARPAVHAGELPKVSPESVELSAEKLAALKPALQNLVDEGMIAGGVALVARHGKVAYVTSFGSRDLADKAPMTEDTIFAIASMTKPVTCVAVMTLIEQGKLGLDDAVAKYLPEFENVRVLGDPAADTDTEVATVALKRPVTVRHLLTHTSGLAYGGPLASDARLAKVYEKAGIQNFRFNTIDEQVKRLATLPLQHQPGERWTYGLSHDVLGRLIEVVSGQRFDRYLQERIFTPLDMRDTSFFVPELKRGRVATIYRARLVGGRLAPLPKNYGSETCFSGGAGLFSTARDYARFAQMLLNGGSLGDVRVLKPETIAAMTTNQIGEHRALLLFKYGLGFGLEMAPMPDGGKPALARYFWAGIFSTDFWIDPRNDVVGVIMTQVLPLNHGGTFLVFRKAVDDAIQD
jgi:CubicO group peptidase (beta-lactamase class C family)